MLIQANQSASVFFSNISASISEILANKDIPAGEKDGLVKKQLNLLSSGLAVIGGISDLDLNALLDFSDGPTAGQDYTQYPWYPGNGGINVVSG